MASSSVLPTRSVGTGRRRVAERDDQHERVALVELLAGRRVGARAPSPGVLPSSRRLADLDLEPVVGDRGARLVLGHARRGRGPRGWACGPRSQAKAAPLPTSTASSAATSTQGQRRRRRLVVVRSTTRSSSRYSGGADWTRRPARRVDRTVGLAGLGQPRCRRARRRAWWRRRRRRPSVRSTTGVAVGERAAARGGAGPRRWP